MEYKEKAILHIPGLFEKGGPVTLQPFPTPLSKHTLYTIILPGLFFLFHSMAQTPPN